MQKYRRSAILLTTLLLPLVGLADDGEAASDIVLFFGRFHPIALHMPVGILTVAFLFEIYDFFKPGKLQPQVTTALVGFGAAGGIVAVAFGLMLAEGGGYDEDTIFLHKWMTIGMTFAAIAAFICKFKSKGDDGMKKAYRGFLILAMLVMGPGAHEGGNLTHGKEYLWKYAPDFARKMSGRPAKGEAKAPVQEGMYTNVIQPIFEEKCYSCHGPDKQKGDYRMDSKKAAFTPGDSEEIPIVPGQPMASFLVELITLPGHDDEVMPPEGKTALTDEDIVNIIRWIGDGAEWPDDADSAASAESADSGKEQAAAEPAETPAETTTEPAATETAATEKSAESAKAAPAEEAEEDPKSYEPIIAALKPGVFRDKIHPLLVENCIKCHGPEKVKGKLRVDTPEWIEKGVKGEPVVVAGNPEESTFYTLLTLPEDDDDVMPPEGKGDHFTPEQQELVKKWIIDGADYGRP